MALPLAAQATPAPPGEATATAVQVGELVRVSDTNAHAGPDATGAQATVVEVGGEPVLGLEGSQDSEGDDSGSLLDTGSDESVTAQVAPWETAVSSQDGDGETGTAQASSALTRVHVVGLAHVDVLESSSAATYTDERSTGSAVSNGVDLTVADVVRLVVLHSEVNSEGEGSSHLLGINDTEIGTDEQLGEICALQANPVLSLSCLAASGGIGDTGEVAGEADAVTATSETAETVNPARAFAVSNSSGPGATPALVAPDTELAGTPEAGEERRASAAADDAAAGSLPRTGAVPAPLLWLALVGLGSGGALWYAARRLQSAPVLSTYSGRTREMARTRQQTG